MTTTPLSTLMPGIMFLLFSRSTNGVPSTHVWYKVSSNRITPEQRVSNPGAVNSSSLNAWRFVSVFSTLMLANRLPIVPVLSSAASNPFPGTLIAVAVAMSSSWNLDLKGGMFAMKCVQVPGQSETVRVVLGATGVVREVRRVGVESCFIHSSWQSSFFSRVFHSFSPERKTNRRFRGQIVVHRMGVRTGRATVGDGHESWG